jgi:hypothetical protein
MITQGTICNDCGALVEATVNTYAEAQAQLEKLVQVHELVCDHNLLKKDMAYLNAQYEKDKARK